jgi:hypothetical protein
MPVCGFNEEMIEGLNSFHNGLVEIILEKLPVNKKEKKFLLEEKKDALLRI